MGFDILVVDDEGTMRNSLTRLLAGDGYSVRQADCARAALGEVRKEHPDLVLLDICLPDTSGFEVLTEVKQINHRIVVIVMTGYESTRDAVLAMKQGAYDYLSKPFNIDAMRLLIKKALEKAPVRKECWASSPAPWQGSACDRMIGTSPAMKWVFDIIHRLPANSGSNVLIEGETGTGKELLAHAIHEMSTRAAEPFVAISCGAIPPELMESELFGYDRGAFTGARPEGKQGILEQAGGGTILLDEIGELSLKLQAKLLRVLEMKEYRRVGGLRNVRLHARLIAATSRHLKQEVNGGRFRADLYYRLNVVHIALPPLRERRNDIMPVAETFLQEFNALYNKDFRAVSRPARKLLESYAWPGNVRELRNVIERIVLLESGDVVLPDNLPRELLDSAPLATHFPPMDDSWCDRRLDSVERACIVQALEVTGGNVINAARLLGLKRGALRYRMAKHGITRRCSQRTAGKSRWRGPDDGATPGDGPAFPQCACVGGPKSERRR